MRPTDPQARLASQILRVNHAGEHGAMAIYRAQMAKLIRHL
jgi:demethoxyubiquinone hydroxylase (CLK1/Coq7/Cat5 family)